MPTIPTVTSILNYAEAIVLVNAPPIFKPLLVKQMAAMRETKGFRLRIGLAGLQEGDPFVSWIHVEEQLAGVQLFHEASLILDDIIDHTAMRRGRPALHMSPYNRITAAACAGYLVSIALRQFSHNTRTAQMLEAICVAEALQRKMKHAPRPILIPTWTLIALGDTGALFRLAQGCNPNQSLTNDTLVERLALLYHGLDDISDFLEDGPFAGGRNADLVDRVPTLLDCFVDTALIDATPEAQQKAVKRALHHLITYFPPAKQQGDYAPLFEELRVIHSALYETAHIGPSVLPSHIDSQPIQP
jgi:geranylgeranyl pyrophosphate synthase